MLSKDEILSLIYHIKEEEEKNWGLDFNIKLIHPSDYIKNSFKENNNLKDKVTKSIHPMIANGYYNGNEIIIYGNNSSISDTDTLVNIASTIYHEIRHDIQKRKPEVFTEYENFILNNFCYINSAYYLSKPYHDKYFHEIDASLYSAYKTKNILNYLNAKEEYENKQERKTIKQLYRINNYDFDYFFNLYLKIIKANNIKNTKEMEVFLDEKGNIKSLDEIINNELYRTMDDEIKYSILSNKKVIKNIKGYDNEIINSLDFVINKYQNIEKINDSLFDNKLTNINDYFNYSIFIHKKINEKRKLKEKTYQRKR